MHLVGLALGSVAPARLRASGAAPLAAPGGHSLGGERGRRGEREATRTEPGAGTGIFITPVISLRGARLLGFPSPAALCTTLRPVRGGRRRVPGAGVWRREGMRQGGGGGARWSGAAPRRGARARPGHASQRVLTRPTAAPGLGPTRRGAQLRACGRVPRGRDGNGGLQRGSEFPSSPPLPHACAPAQHSRRRGRAGPNFQVPFRRPRRLRSHNPAPGIPGEESRRESPRRAVLPRGTSPGRAAQLGKALVRRLWLEKTVLVVMVVLTDLLKS